MIDMERNEKDKNVVFCFMKNNITAHISKSNGKFMNGKILRVFDDFFIIDDFIYGNTNVFFNELNKPVEEFKEVEK